MIKSRQRPTLQDPLTQRKGPHFWLLLGVGAYTLCMALSATITDLMTGELLQRLGPFESAGAARAACAEAAGQILRWQRAGETWEALTEAEVYHVPREQPLESKAE